MEKPKTVFVTGSSRGIGRAIAAAFSAEGYNLAINCVKNAEMLAEFEAELKITNKNVISILCDMSDYSAAEAAFREINRAFGGVDILVNNAGISRAAPFNLTEPPEWRELIDNNVYSALNASHLALPHMLRQHDGCIINISSIWGISGASCEAVYSLTKGGLNAFTKALAKETAPNGVRVNAIACGVIDTEMNAFLNESERSELIEQIPARRFGLASEVADLAVFLASGKASYLTGQVIALDGGFL